jgi:hypothetical protein
MRSRITEFAHNPSFLQGILWYSRLAACPVGQAVVAREIDEASSLSLCSCVAFSLHFAEARAHAFGLQKCVTRPLGTDAICSVAKKQTYAVHTCINKLLCGFTSVNSVANFVAKRQIVCGYAVLTCCRNCSPHFSDAAQPGFRRGDCLRRLPAKPPRSTSTSASTVLRSTPMQSPTHC